MSHQTARRRVTDDVDAHIRPAQRLRLPTAVQGHDGARDPEAWKLECEDPDDRLHASDVEGLSDQGAHDAPVASCLSACAGARSPRRGRQPQDFRDAEGPLDERARMTEPQTTGQDVDLLFKHLREHI